jgi:NADH-quinone oxidoreductase subunit L
MMMGLGAGGVAVGMFHLITHAFFKALLFLGAGSVIHGCHHEQDIRRMGGLREKMPVTFMAYAVGMLALAGFPLLFSGFWSKDEILHATLVWGPSKIPFSLGLLGAAFTAFYMTRQVILVFFGKYRGHHQPHESPPVMTMPLIVLAVFTILLSFIGTPVWSWFQNFLTGETASKFHLGMFLALALSSSAMFALGCYCAWRVYAKADAERDPLEIRAPGVMTVLKNKFYFDEIHRDTVIAFYNFAGRAMAVIEDVLWRATVQASSVVLLAVAWLNRLIDEFAVNGGFDRVTRGLRRSGAGAAQTQTGQIQSYLRVIAIAVAVLVLFLAWGGK